MLSLPASFAVGHGGRGRHEARHPQEPAATRQVPPATAAAAQRQRRARQRRGDGRGMAGAKGGLGVE